MATPPAITVDNDCLIFPASLTIFDLTEIYASIATFEFTATPMSLDFRHVDELDGAGIQLVLWLAKKCVAAGGSVNLSNYNEDVVAMLTLFQIPMSFGGDSTDD